jgi:hypothetical protein
VKGWRIAVGGLAVIGIVFAATFYSFPRDEDREWKHIVRVLLRAEYGYRTPLVRRWMTPIKLRLLFAVQQDRDVVDDLVNDINTLIAESGVGLSVGDFKLPSVSVSFLSQNVFSEVAEKTEIDYRPGNLGWFYTEGGQDGAVKVGVILIADELAGVLRRHAIQEEIYQVLGPFNDSPLYTDSIVYETDDDGARASRLSDLDRKLLRFLYLYLKPGDDIAALRRAYDAHWRTMTVPPRPVRH